MSDNKTDYSCIVPFPDQSKSFVHGFEAGMIWQCMLDGEREISPDVAVHADNEEVFRRMASAQGYDIEIDGRGDGWFMLRLTKRRNRLTVVK